MALILALMACLFSVVAAVLTVLCCRRTRRQREALTTLYAMHAALLYVSMEAQTRAVEMATLQLEIVLFQAGLMGEALADAVEIAAHESGREQIMPRRELPFTADQIRDMTFDEYLEKRDLILGYMQGTDYIEATATERSHEGDDRRSGAPMQQRADLGGPRPLALRAGPDESPTEE